MASLVLGWLSRISGIRCRRNCLGLRLGVCLGLGFGSWLNSGWLVARLLLLLTRLFVRRGDCLGLGLWVSLLAGWLDSSWVAWGIGRWASLLLRLSSAWSSIAGGACLLLRASRLWAWTRALLTLRAGTRALVSRGTSCVAWLNTAWSIRRGTCLLLRTGARWAISRWTGSAAWLDTGWVTWGISRRACLLLRTCLLLWTGSLRASLGHWAGWCLTLRRAVR